MTYIMTKPCPIRTQQLTKQKPTDTVRCVCGNTFGRDSIGVVVIQKSGWLDGDCWDDRQRRVRWMELCQLAAHEQDPKKLTELFAEINRILAAKQRLKGDTFR